MKPNKVAIILTVILIILCVSKAHCQDAWDSTNGTIIKYDKAEHALGSAGLYTGFRLIGASPGAAFIYTFGLGFVWEVKDHYMSWEKYGWWGDGHFSIPDLAADFIGTFLACFIDVKILGANVTPWNNGLTVVYSW